jgi:hypothetical protein
MILNDIPDTSESFALLAVGGQDTISTVLQEASDFDLVDLICQSAEWFSNVTPDVANLKRSRILDAMLSINRMDPIFMTLTENQCLKIGNSLTRFLVARAGAASMERLVDGRLLLSELGLNDELNQKISSLMYDMKISRSNAPRLARVTYE